MSNTTAVVFDMPPWLEAMNLLRQRLASLTEPLADSLASSRSLAAAFDVPAIRNIGNLTKLYTPEMLTSIQRVQKVFATLYATETMEVFRQQQEVFRYFNALNLQLNISDRAQDWSRGITESLPKQYESFSVQKEAELSRLSDLADRMVHENGIDASCGLSESDQQLVIEEVEDIFSFEKNWEQRFAASIEKFSKTHPVVAWVLKNIFFAILIGVITNMASTFVGQAMTSAKVYDQPQTSSNVVYHIEQNQTILVVGEVPYYYEIEVKDEATGCLQTGYVSKRSVHLNPVEEPLGRGAT